MTHAFNSHGLEILIAESRRRGHSHQRLARQRQGRLAIPCARTQAAQRADHEERGRTPCRMERQRAAKANSVQRAGESIPCHQPLAPLFSASSRASASSLRQRANNNPERSISSAASPHAASRLLRSWSPRLPSTTGACRAFRRVSFHRRALRVLSTLAGGVKHRPIFKICTNPMVSASCVPAYRSPSSCARNFRVARNREFFTVSSLVPSASPITRSRSPW